MPNFSKVTYIILFVCLTSVRLVYSQDTLAKPKKNIMKVNLTSGLLYDVPLLFEYERILSSHTSFSIQAGYSRLPFETNSDSLRWTSDIQSSGYNVTIDYRFYLRKENKDPAPHGVYLAPFVSYFHFTNDRDLAFTGDSTDIPLNIKSTYNFLSVGGALGYQFTFGKRWVLDCLLLGPSLSYYHVDMKLKGDITESELNEIERGMLESLASHVPFLNKLLDDQIASFTGTLNSWNYGFRYSVHLGYRF
jgi:hypothetical protein